MAKVKINVAKDVKEKMHQIKDAKAAQLNEIQEKKAAAMAELEKAWEDIKSAVASLDSKAYGKAKQHKADAENAIEMFDERYKQLKEQALIEEAESDKIIDSLLQYEEDLSYDFIAEITPLVKQLAKLHRDYVKAVAEAEGTISSWERSICANHRTWGRSLRHDSETGKLTDRSEKAVPVHILPYEGCQEAAQLASYLKRSEAIYKD
ncbi:MAG: hypothetical protein II918_02490 [Firmicutes bacterium]|nr:hypothetical protein [Bacillota bacterium]